MDASRPTSTSLIPKTEANLTNAAVTSVRHPSDGSEQPPPRVLNERDDYESTAYMWSLKKKWILLTVVALCQTSMNFNAAIYSNAVEPINEHFGISNARMGMVAFLVPYVPKYLPLHCVDR
jgi:hypothetical protein